MNDSDHAVCGHPDIKGSPLLKLLIHARVTMKMRMRKRTRRGCSFGGRGLGLSLKVRVHGKRLVSFVWSCPFAWFYSLWSFNAVRPPSDLSLFRVLCSSAAKSRKPAAHELLI